MNKKWNCEFQPLPKHITVGQKLNLFCNKKNPFLFKSNLFIEFQDKKDMYRLHILKIKQQGENFLSLEVTPYRSGVFQTPFFISDGETKVLIDNLVFSVSSVLQETKPTVSSYGPYGPFKEPLPLWSWLAIFLSVCFISLWLITIVYRFVKIKKNIKKILNRKTYLQPSKNFIKGLRKYKEDSQDYLQNLERLFKIFLEDLLLIPVLNTKNKKIIAILKKHYQQIYKKKGQAIQQVLNEFSKLKYKTVDKEHVKKLKKLSQKTVFFLEEGKEKNEME